MSTFRLLSFPCLCLPDFRWKPEWGCAIPQPWDSPGTGLPGHHGTPWKEENPWILPEWISMKINHLLASFYWESPLHCLLKIHLTNTQLKCLRQSTTLRCRILQWATHVHSLHLLQHSTSPYFLLLFSQWSVRFFLAGICRNSQALQPILRQKSHCSTAARYQHFLPQERTLIC